MWRKYIIIIGLFYLFALLQGSFFAHFNVFGSIPNLVFIFFFLLIFFEKQDKFYPAFIWSLAAGFFLDVFFYTYLGPSIILLIIIGFLIKETKLLLKNRGDGYSFVYFLSLFSVYFIIYQILNMIYLRFFDLSHMPMIFDAKFLSGIFYNLFFASIGFWIFKKIKANVRKI